MLLLIGIGTVLSIIFFTYLMTPSWEATTKILIERNSTQDLGIFKSVNKPVGNAVVVGNDALNMMILLTGENMAYQIVDEFGLDKRLRKKRFEPRNFREKTKNRIVDFFMIPKYMLQKIGLLSKGEKNWTDAAAENLIEEQQDIDIESESNVISITILGETRDLAVNIANRMVELLKERSSSFSREAARETYAFVQNQMSVAERNLKEAEDDVARYKINNSIVTLEEEKSLKMARIDSLEAELDDTSKEIEETTSRLAQVNQEMEKVDERVILSAIIARNPLVTSLEGKLEDLEIELASMMLYKTENHPEVKMLTAEIVRIRLTLLETVKDITNRKTESINPLYQSLLTRSINLKIDDIALNAREKAINKALVNINYDIQSIPKREFELARREEILKVNSLVYQALNTKLGELNVEMRSVISEYGVRVLDRAYLSPSAESTWPKWMLSILAAMLFSFIFGFGSIFTLEFFNDSIKSAKDVDTLLDAPCIGVLPDLTMLRSQDPLTGTLVEDEA
ncbi:MAG: hypothetical protein IME98_01870 [Proteobacteria bacterium]|nr:hypothetical protein [Pseudomonadota bacterium]